MPTLTYHACIVGGQQRFTSTFAKAKKRRTIFRFRVGFERRKKKGQDKIDLGLISERHHSPFWKSALTSKILNLLYRIQ